MFVSDTEHNFNKNIENHIYIFINCLYNYMCMRNQYLTTILLSDICHIFGHYCYYWKSVRYLNIKSHWVRLNWLAWLVMPLKLIPESWPWNMVYKEYGLQLACQFSLYVWDSLAFLLLACLSERWSSQSVGEESAAFTLVYTQWVLIFLMKVIEEFTERQIHCACTGMNMNSHSLLC